MQSYSEAEHKETIDTVHRSEEKIEADLHQELRALRHEIRELKDLINK